MNTFLQTADSGSYVVSFEDENGVLLNRVRYSVVGDGNDSIRVNRNANLELKLNKVRYLPGSDVEISVKAPYAGFGLITIERDSIKTSQWFKSEGTSSVQKISLPSDIVGNTYITVLLARAWDSKEIYLPPLSYASVPVTIDEATYTTVPKLTVPTVVKPGEKIKVEYTIDEPGSLLV